MSRRLIPIFLILTCLCTGAAAQQGLPDFTLIDKQARSIRFDGDLIKHQCEVGLRWLQAGRIEGIIFLGNTVLDLGFESAEWTRQWIQQVGDTELN